MKLDKGLKVALLILLIVLVSIISFVGIYVQEKHAMKNLVKDYIWGMDLEGSRHVGLVVDTSKKTIYYDKDGNVVEKEDKNGKTEKVPVNSEEVLNKENYLLTKKIIEKRLNDVGISDFLIRHNEKTGQMIVQIPEDGLTDLAIQYIYSVGKFTIEDENGNVLLDNSNLKSAKVGYITENNGTKVYLNLEFNKDSVEKLKEISNTYVETTNEEGKKTTKKVSIKIDGSEMMSTSFEEEISNGVLSLAVGSASTSSSDINSYIAEASNIAILLNSGNLPIQYKLNQNRYIMTDITRERILVISLAVAIVALIACIYLIVRYKKNGLLASISFVGYVAVLLLALRYANVMITTEGLFGILISMMLNYVFSLYLLRILKNKPDSMIEKKNAYDKTIIDMVLLLIPSLIVGITFCFTKWLPMYSFGAIIFWGILVILIYNTFVTKTLIVLGSKNK